MASATLPISSTDAAAAANPLPTARLPLTSLLRRVSSTVRRTFADRRPWPEFVDRNAFSKPETLALASTRVRKNFSYFRTNYLLIISLVLAIFLFSHPFTFLTLLTLIGAWLFVYAFRPSDQPLVVFGRTFSDRETLGILILASAVIVFMTSVGSLLISAVMVGLTVVSIHGAFRDPEDLFMDDNQHNQEGAGTGVFSFIGGAASTAAAAAAPEVMIRV